MGTGKFMMENNYEYSKDYEAEGQYPFKRVGGGDGMQVQIDRRDSDVIYVFLNLGFTIV